MQYEPTFDRNSKGKFNDENNYVSVKAGSCAYLLEDELNEMQWIQYEKNSSIIRCLMNSGFINNLPEYNNSEGNGIFVKNGTFILSLANHIDVNINGYLFKLLGTYKKDINDADTTNNNIILNYDSSITNNLVYLQMWFEDIDYDKNNNIKKYGGNNNSVLNTFEYDKRINLKTSQRVQLKWEVKIAKNVNSLLNVNIQNINFKQNNGIDNNFYICQLPNSITKNSLDNIYYAIPLGNIINNSFITNYPKSEFYLSRFKNNNLYLENLELLNINDTTFFMDKNTNSERNISCKNIQIKDNNLDNYSLLKNDNNTISLENNNNQKTNLILGNINSNDIISNDLTVNGNNCTIKSQNLKFNSNKVLFNTKLTSSPNEDCILEFNRGTSPSSVLLWDEQSKIWKCGLSGEEDIILNKNKPTIIEPNILNKIKITGNNDDKINIYNTSGINNTNSIIFYDKDENEISKLSLNTNSKMWYIISNKNSKRVATLDDNNKILMDSNGNYGKVKIDYGLSTSKGQAQGNGTLFIGTDDKKIYFDYLNNGTKTWSRVGMPKDIADCDNNFHYDNVAPTNTTRLNYNGYFYATRIYNAIYNDYAEYFEKGENNLEPGDVIISDNNNKYIKSNSENNNLVVGVYSDSYGHILGGNGTPDDKNNFIPIGLAGRVNVKVIGNIKVGDLLVTSNINGVATSCKNYVPGTVIGKALQNYNSNSVGKIKMLIMNI